MYRRWLLICLLPGLMVIVIAGVWYRQGTTFNPASSPAVPWSAAELEILRGLSLGSLPPLPPDPANAVADRPEAIALGHKLFFDARLSANRQVACAVCHIPQLTFTDGMAIAHGTRPHTRNTPTLSGVAYQPWLHWDGSIDTLWGQALEPLEAPDEHGATRLAIIHLIVEDDSYRSLYEALFGPLPDFSDFARFPDQGGPLGSKPARTLWENMTPADQTLVTDVFVNLGKALAAYERLLQPAPGRFDDYVQALLTGNAQRAASILTPNEIAGLRLFIGRGNCLQCHQGPLFSDGSFHNTGVPLVEGQPVDQGRTEGITRLLKAEFNCASPYNDADSTACPVLSTEQTNDPGQLYAFKTPTLRHIAATGPYMHAGQFDSLRQVLEHYSQPPAAPLGQTELAPLHLSETELAQLEAFLRTLSSPLATPPQYLEPPTN